MQKAAWKRVVGWEEVARVTAIGRERRVSPNEVEASFHLLFPDRAGLIMET